MKRFVYLLSVLALVVSMQGCSENPISNEPEKPNSPFTAVQLRLTGQIATTPSTRVNADGFEANDKVGVYVSSTGSLATSSNILNNVAFTYSSGNINAPAEEEVFWESEDALLSVFAYYPYSASISNNATYPFTVAANQSTAANFYNSDFITAQAKNLTPQAEAVNLTFYHSLSRINITLQAGEGITADELAAAEKSFSIGGLATNGTINLATGVATAGTSKASITPLENNDVDYSAIVYPQESTVTFLLETNGDIYTYTTDVDLTAGYQYQFNLTLNTWESPELILSATTITPWEDSENENNGEMEKYEDTSEIITNLDTNLKSYFISVP